MGGLQKGFGLLEYVLELCFFMPKVRFPLTLDDLEVIVSTRELTTVILADGDVAGFSNL